MILLSNVMKLCGGFNHVRRANLPNLNVDGV
jgi:hypothetical protein